MPLGARSSKFSRMKRFAHVRVFTVALAFALVAALGGCDSINPLSKPIVQPCPEYAILEDAATLTKFRDGPGRDLTDISYRAEMKTIKMECVSRIDTDTKEGSMDITVAPVIGAELGAAYTGGDTVVPMFVVVLSPDKKILFRSEVKMSISFEGNKNRLVATAPQTTIELPIRTDINSRYYRVYGGFALTRDEVEYNRAQISKGLR